MSKQFERHSLISVRLKSRSVNNLTTEYNKCKSKSVKVKVKSVSF